MPEIYRSKKKSDPIKKPESSFSVSRQTQASKGSGNTRDLKPKPRYGMGPRFITVAERLHRQRKKGRFQTFSVMPGRVRFETQERKEKVILLLRQHWLTQVRWMVIAFLMLFAPLTLLWIPLINFMPGPFQLMAVVIWYLILIAFVYEEFLSWFYRVFIITDERVIDIDFYHLLYKEISGAKIDNIEDVTLTQGGMVRAMFNYGDVSIQTAAEKREFTIESVPEPNRVVKILNELILEEEHEKIIGKVR